MSRFYYWNEANQQLVPLGILHMIHDVSLIKIEEDLDELYVPVFGSIPNIYNELFRFMQEEDEEELELITPILIEIEEDLALSIVIIPTIYNEIGTWNDEFEFELLDP